MEPEPATEQVSQSLNLALVDRHKSPFESAADREIQARVEEELRQVPEPYRTVVVLRDIEDLSYEEIAEITQVSLGTVKSRITRGRAALRKRLGGYANEVGSQLGLAIEDSNGASENSGIEVAS